MTTFWFAAPGNLTANVKLRWLLKTAIQQISFQWVGNPILQPGMPKIPHRSTTGDSWLGMANERLHSLGNREGSLLVYHSSMKYSPKLAVL